ncbi:MAG: 5'/3'-nucleotidase SurE [Oscillospiraceae bacterium]|nr:5'/3'-nucleotidase SurE [Oscillospiraceae bacterium]
MRILITNDDSIHSPVLPALIKWAKELGEVVVVVPKFEQSAKSHSVEIRKPFEVLPCNQFPGVRAYTVDSSPADCVRYAILGLHETFDLVISGINLGFNIGWDLFYSGTVAAAMEAVSFGCRAIALSTDKGDFSPALSRLDEVWALFEKEKLLEQNLIYNVNIPTEVKGIRITRQGGPYFTDEFPSVGEHMVQAIGTCIYEENHDYTVDTNAVMHGYISITPLTTERTHLNTFHTLKHLNP